MEYADGAFDIMEDGKQESLYGRIVDPYQKTELAAAIEEIFADKERLIAMQQACYERAQQFRFSEVSKGFYEALRETI